MKTYTITIKGTKETQISIVITQEKEGFKAKVESSDKEWGLKDAFQSELDALLFARSKAIDLAYGRLLSEMSMVEE